MMSYDDEDRGVLETKPNGGYTEIWTKRCRTGLADFLKECRLVSSPKLFCGRFHMQR